MVKIQLHRFVTPAPCGTGLMWELKRPLIASPQLTHTEVPAIASSPAPRRNKKSLPAKKIISGVLLDASDQARAHVRYLILLMLKITTTINYADRSYRCSPAPACKDLGIDAVTPQLYLLSAFGYGLTWRANSSGWLLDRFGSKKSMP